MQNSICDFFSETYKTNLKLKNEKKKKINKIPYKTKTNPEKKNHNALKLSHEI